MKRDLRLWLDLLFGAEPRENFAELRWRLRNGAGMGREFHQLADRDALARLIMARGRTTDLYVGVAPRARREGTRQAVERVHVLWADCDSPESREAVASVSPAPSAIVSSGSGQHVYWALWEGIEPDVAEQANRHLAASLGADTRATDAARILRPPGTSNFKTGEAVPVALEYANADRIYTVSEIVGDLPPVEQSERPRAVARINAGTDPLHALPASEYVPALTGREPDRAGKVACPFHEDRTPSLHAYDDPAQGFMCFGCGKGGSIIDFGAALYGVEPRGAGFQEIRRRLAADLLGTIESAA